MKRSEQRFSLDWYEGCLKNHESYARSRVAKAERELEEAKMDAAKCAEHREMLEAIRKTGATSATFKQMKW